MERLDETLALMALIDYYEDKIGRPGVQPGARETYKGRIKRCMARLHSIAGVDME